MQSSLSLCMLQACSQLALGGVKLAVGRGAMESIAFVHGKGFFQWVFPSIKQER